MQLLTIGSTGLDVQKWEWFLTGQGFSPGKDDGLYDAITADATRSFQGKWNLGIDGKVGRETLGKAVALGFGEVDPTNTDKSGPNWPPKPAFEHLSDDRKIALFGQFQYRPSPTPDNPEAITILGDWEAQHIISIEIPQLVGIAGAPHSGQIRCHKAVAQQFQNLFKAIDDAGLMNRVLSWGGSYNARFIRGSTTRLSNHSYGSACDINVAWNPLGAEPPLVGHTGSTRELAPIMNQHGFYWGGHFTRLDGMHGEIAQIVNG